MMSGVISIVYWIAFATSSISGTIFSSSPSPSADHQSRHQQGDVSCGLRVAMGITGVYDLSGLQGKQSVQAVQPSKLILQS
ncbi:MAG: hypothetical protein WAM42_16205 [Candidatus Nitrosopolaris sp.]